MIKIGNHEWRTLRQPIIAQSKVVKEVWINDTNMVYPEGTFLKIRTRFKHTYRHYHFGSEEYYPREVYGGEKGIGSYEPNRVPVDWSITLAGVLIIRARTNTNLDITMRQTDYIPSYETLHSMDMYSGVQGMLIRPNDNSYSIKCKSCSPDFGTEWDWVDARVKYRVDPIPVCGPYRQWFSGNSPFSTFFTNKSGHSYPEDDGILVSCGYVHDIHGNISGFRTVKISPAQGTIPGPSEFNERIFAIHPGQGELQIGSRITSADPDDGYTEIDVSNKGFALSGRYAYRVGLDYIRWYSESDDAEETEERLGEYYTRGDMFFQSPFNDVMFLGPEEEASAEDLEISDNDLELESIEEYFDTVADGAVVPSGS